MLDKLKYIEINGEQVPYQCTISALADIQEEYGSIERFEKELLGIVATDKTGRAIKTKEPSIKAAVWGISLFVENGIRIYNRKAAEGSRIEFKIADIGDVNMTPEQLKVLVHEAFIASIQIKKEEPLQDQIANEK